MKAAAIVYHKNIKSIYKEEWIEKSFGSILNQTYKDFSIYELNYGNDDLKLYREFVNNKKYHYYQIEMQNHVEAMNFLIDECLKDGCDIVFNNNLDDINHKNRFKIQAKFIENGFDIVSSNFIHIDDVGIEVRKMKFDSVDIQYEFNKGNNVICHPSVCYSKNFLLKNRYNPTEIPQEDFLLWKKTLKNYKFHICSDYLLNYRLHSNQVTKINNKNKEDEVKVQPTTIQMPVRTFINNNNIARCSCGEPKNKIKYNFCQKCNKLY